MADHEPHRQRIAEPGHSHDAVPPLALPGKQTLPTSGADDASVAAPRPSGARRSSPRTPEDERRFIELFGGAPEASWNPASLLAAPAGADSHELPRLDLAARGANAKSAAKGGADSQGGRGAGPRPRPLESKAHPPAAGAEQATHSAVIPERELLLLGYLSEGRASATQLQNLLFSGLDPSEAIELHARLSAEPPPRADRLATAFRARLSTAECQSILTRLAAFNPMIRGERAWSELAPGEATQPFQLVSRVDAPHGVYLRSQPAGPKDGRPWLPLDTLVSVTRKTERGWYWVTSLGDDHPERVAPTGVAGFIESRHVASNMPEPTAHLQEVKSEAMLKDIVEARYGVTQRRDAWVYVQAIYHANKDRDAVFRQRPQLGVDRRPLSTTNPQAVLELWHTARVAAGQALWLPSKEYIQQLKAAGVIYEASLSNVLQDTGGRVALSLMEHTQYAAGFGAGLLEGAWGALADLLTGVLDLIKLHSAVIRTIFMGIFTGFSELQELASKLSGVWAKRSDLITAFATDFMSKWESKDDWKRGNFQGEVVGYLTMLMLLICATVGGTAAVAGAGRFGSFVKLIQLADAAGSIGTYARHLRGVIKLPQKFITDTAQVLGKKIVKPDAASGGSGHTASSGNHGNSGHTGSGHTGSGHTGSGHTGSGHTGSGHSGTPHAQEPSSQTPHGPTSQASRSSDPHGPSMSGAPAVRRNRGEPYGDPRVHPKQPHRYLEKHELVPTSELKLATTWQQTIKRFEDVDGVPIGHKLRSESEGHELVARLARGDASALKQLGLNDAPHDLDTTGREWALIETRDGFVIYAGCYNKVQLPAAARKLAHSHPGTKPAHPLDADEQPAIDLPVPEGGQTYAEILKDFPTAKQAGIMPSAVDIHAISNGGEHVIYTRFVHHGNGKIGNSVPGKTAARVNLHLGNTHVALFNPRTQEYWYIVHMHVRDSTGKSLWSGDVYAYWIPGPQQLLRTQVDRPAILDRAPAGGWQRP